MKTRQITVAYLIDSLSFGGAEKQLALLVRALPKPFSPVVISLTEQLDPFGHALESEGFDVFAVKRRSHVDLVRFLEVTRILNRVGADIVHGFLDASNAYAFLAARLLRKPVMLSLQSTKLRLSGPKAAALSWMLRHADRVWVNSKAGRESLRTDVHVPEGRILHIPNWVDPGSISGARELPPPDEPKTIGFVGRFAEPKRLHLLVEAFRTVHDKVPASRLVLMGGGPEYAMLRRQCAELGIESNVEFIEPGLDVEGTLRRLHCFVLPSAFEGLPNSAVEALALGVPVLATPVGDVPDLVVEGKTGELLTSDDPSAIAEVIIRWVSDPFLLENARIEGPRLVAAKFSLASAIEALLPAYETLLSMKTP